MAAAVKQEPVEDTDLETRVLLLCQENPDGITDAMIQTDMPQFDVKQRVTAINRLLSTGRIDLLKSSSGKLIYKIKDTGAQDAVKGADQQEKVVYQIIKDAGNKGIWIRDIRFRSNLSLTQVNKILKNLESKKLIKAVKSVAASKKKVYMLYNLEPDRTVTGGAWYSDQDFESEFVEVLNQQCYKFLVQKVEATRESLVDPIAQLNGSYVSSKDVWKYISELGISKVQLSVEDIETILDTLIYDGKVERSIVASSDGQNKLYRAINQLVEPTGLMRMPCGSCPIPTQPDDKDDISQPDDTLVTPSTSTQAGSSQPKQQGKKPKGSSDHVSVLKEVLLADRAQEDDIRKPVQDLGKMLDARQAWAAWFASVCQDVPKERFREFQQETFTVSMRYFQQSSQQQPLQQQMWQHLAPQPQQPIWQPPSAPVPAAALSGSPQLPQQNLQLPKHQHGLYTPTQDVQGYTAIAEMGASSGKLRPKSAPPSSNIIQQAFNAIIGHTASTSSPVPSSQYQPSAQPSSA